MQKKNKGMGGITKLRKAIEEKTVKPVSTITALAAFWSPEAFVMVGLLGRMCLIMLLDKNNKVTDQTIADVPNSLTVMAPEAENPLDTPEELDKFWCSERVGPYVYQMLSNYNDEVNGVIDWKPNPHGIFADLAYVAQDHLQINLLTLINIHVNENLGKLQPILADEIKKEEEARAAKRPHKRQIPAPKNAEQAEQMQESIHSLTHLLSVLRHARSIPVQDQAEFHDIIDTLIEDFAVIHEYMIEALRKTAVGRAFFSAHYDSPTIEA